MLNRVVLVGRLTSDPQLKTTPSGLAVANFTLAVNRHLLNERGEREADFIPVIVWRKQAENAAKYLKKGSLAGVDGRMQTRNYDDQDGRRVYVTEVIAESVQYLDTKVNSQQQNTSTTSNAANYNADPFSSNQKIDVTEKDTPF